MTATERVIEMNTGATIPTIGFGTWSLNGRVELPVVWALEAGYRHIDTAKIYGTEEDIGRAIARSGIPREEIFITTKLWNSDQGYESGLLAFDESLARLGTDYVDLYLIHWPFTNEREGENRREPSWRALEEIHQAGKAKAIGVSNYEMEHIVEMENYAEIPPAVNQIEVHPFWYRKELIDYCHEHGIVVVNYSPLTRTKYFSNPTLTDVAKKHDKSVAQVLLRRGIQHGNVVIPHSSKKEHIEENINIFDFELSAEEMAQLDALNIGDSVVD